MESTVEIIPGMSMVLISIINIIVLFIIPIIVLVFIYKFYKKIVSIDENLDEMNESLKEINKQYDDR